MNLEDMKKTIVSPAASLRAAMKLLGGSGAGIRVLFVVDDEDKLIGSVTDGDIRRAILNGVSFERPVSEIMFKSPRFVRRSDKEFENKAKRYVMEEKLYAIPALDDSGRITDILFWFNFFDNHPLESHSVSLVSNPVVIMAGGKGTRLDPFTKILPKPLIPFGDKPIIEKIMDNFNRYGFNRFILTLNYKKEIIKMYFRENQFPYSVEWVEEEAYLGTAGSLGLLKDKLNETFFVCNCDVLLESDFKNILLWHKGEKALITLIGCHKEMVIPYGALEMNDGHLKTIKERPTFDIVLNTGVYIMEPAALEYISPGEHIDMNHLIERVKAEGKVTVYPVCDGWFDLGQWKEYKESLYHLEAGRESGSE
ncbi:MAG: nucleotidyltransferase family protein [Candidatus Omnitrophota bacterium]